MIEKTVFDNNVVLITESDSSSRTAALGFWFAAGSRYENKENRGISHLTEHLLFKGTEKLNTRETALTFDRMGGFVNAFTERENVCLYSVVPSLNGNFETACSCLFDMCENCTFPEDEFSKEKNVVKSEILSLDDDSDESALDELARSVWDDETLTRTIGGSVKEVDSLSLEKVRAFYAEYFVHGELVIVAAGKIDAELLKKKASLLSLHKKVPDYKTEFHFTKPAVWKSGVNIVKTRFLQSQIFATFQIEGPLTEKESYALCILDAIAGGTMSSRLFQTLREKHGLCYSVYSFFTFYENAYLWSSYVTADKDNALQTVELLMEELRNLREEKISDEEFENAKKHICGEEIMGSCDNEYIMKRHQKNLSLGFPLRSTEEVLECIRNIEKSDIISLIEKIFRKEKMNLLVYGPSLSSRVKKEILCLAK